MRIVLIAPVAPIVNSMHSMYTVARIARIACIAHILIIAAGSHDHDCAHLKIPTYTLYSQKICSHFNGSIYCTVQQRHYDIQL